MEGLPFLDTNVFIRYFVNDEPNHAQRAAALFDRIALGQLAVRTSETVIFETVYTLQRLYRVPRLEIRAKLLPIVQLPGIHLVEKGVVAETFDLYVANNFLSFADCHHAVLTKRVGLPVIISFDQDFDRIPGITGREPE